MKSFVPRKPFLFRSARIAATLGLIVFSAAASFAADPEPRSTPERLETPEALAGDALTEGTLTADTLGGDATPPARATDEPGEEATDEAAADDAMAPLPRPAETASQEAGSGTDRADASSAPSATDAGVGSDRTSQSEAERYYNLGTIQRKNGELDAALESYRSSLEQYRESHGRWASELVPVLRGMGATHQARGEHERAIEHFARALYLRRMNAGLHDLSQLPLLSELIESRLALGQWEDVHDLQQRAYLVREQAHGTDNPDLVPALYDLAAWYRQTSQVRKARGLYEQALELMEEHYGEDDLRLVPALKGIAATIKRERYPIASPEPREPSFRMDVGRTPRSIGPTSHRGADQLAAHARYSDGEEALERAVEIQRKHADEVPAHERAELLTQLADWHLIFDDWREAFDAYARARQVLLEGGASAGEVDQAFAEPYPLVLPLPKAASRAPPDGRARPREGQVVIEYDVSARGQVHNIRIVESEPEGVLDFRVRKAIRAARFRPRFAEGEAVATENARYRHTFRYYEEREEEDGDDQTAGGSPADPARAAQEASGGADA